MTDGLLIRFDLLSQMFVITCKWCGEQTLISALSMEELGLVDRAKVRHKAGCIEGSS